MALFENSVKKAPLGIELVRRGVITEKDIDTAFSYQREHPNMKLRRNISLIKISKR